MATKRKEDKIVIKLKKIHPDAVIPKYAHDGDVCMDMTAIDVEYVPEHDMYIYHTGLAFESDKNIGQFLFLRSGNYKTDAYLCNGVGVADSAIYRGEIQFRMKNRVPTETILNDLARSKIANYMVKSIDTIKKQNWFQRFFNKKDYLYLIRELAVLLGQNNYTERELSMTAMAFAPYKVGDRVGQMVFMRYPNVELQVVDELSDSERGENGFGSTGK